MLREPRKLCGEEGRLIRVDVGRIRLHDEPRDGVAEGGTAPEHVDDCRDAEGLEAGHALRPLNGEGVEGRTNERLSAR